MLCLTGATALRGPPCHLPPLHVEHPNHTAGRHGLYPSAANMAGAASGAAWYTLATALLPTEPRLERPLAGDGTAKIIQLVVERLRGAPRSSATVNELVSQAAHLRDVRNYGIHPRGEADAHLEDLFTETSCLALRNNSLAEPRRRCYTDLTVELVVSHWTGWI